jgi:cell division GTPase FtsZ
MADSRANVIFGASVGEVDDGEVMITLIATGLDGHRAAEPVSPATLTGRLRRQAERVKPHAQVPSARQVVTDEPPAVERRAPIEDDNLDLPTFLRKHRPPSTRTG